MPRVSVLLPVRNGSPWIGEALASLSRQTLRDVEILVLEDGSTDGTPALLRDWRDDRVRVIPTGGVGMARALNVGLEAARAPLVARQDADDVSAPVRLDAQAAFLTAHPEIGVLATAADYLDAAGHPVTNAWVRTVRRQQDVAMTPQQIAELMPLTCCVTHGSVMARASVLRAAGGYRANIWPVEDYDLWLRLLPITRFAKLPHRLYRYRVHDAQLSAQVREQQLTEAVAAKLRHVGRTCPRLPSPARVAIVGEGRGADAYRTAARAHGWEAVPALPALQRSGLAMLGRPAMRRLAFESCDLLVVTSFADLDLYARALGAHPGGDTVRVGNVFVLRRWAEQEAA